MGEKGPEGQEPSPSTETVEVNAGAPSMGSTQPAWSGPYTVNVIVPVGLLPPVNVAVSVTARLPLMGAEAGATVVARAGVAAARAARAHVRAHVLYA